MRILCVTCLLSCPPRLCGCNQFSVDWVTGEDLVCDCAWCVTEWIRVFHLSCGSSARSFMVASSVGGVRISAQGAGTKTERWIYKMGGEGGTHTLTYQGFGWA